MVFKCIAHAKKTIVYLSIGAAAYIQVLQQF